jgi:hypothetical protein
MRIEQFVYSPFDLKHVSQKVITTYDQPGLKVRTHVLNITTLKWFDGKYTISYKILIPMLILTIDFH